MCATVVCQCSDDSRSTRLDAVSAGDFACSGGRRTSAVRSAPARDTSRAAPRSQSSAVALCYRCAVPPGTGLPSAPGADPPMNTLRPSGYSKNTATALFSPLFAWYPKILISDPTGRLALVTPFLNRLTGGPPSRPQFVVTPSLTTSIHTHECGLTSSTFVTLPCRLMGLVSSNAAANEWCALTGTATSRRPTAVTTPTKVIVLFMSFLVLSGSQHYIAVHAGPYISCRRPVTGVSPQLL